MHRLLESLKEYVLLSNPPFAIFFLSFMLITGNRTQSACLLQETHLQLQWPRT